MDNSHQLRKICLVDSIGALISASGLLVLCVLPTDLTGLPRPIALSLILIACAFAVNSFIGWRKIPAPDWRKVRTIGFLNIGYCLVSLAVAATLFRSLQPLMLAYFALEMIIVIPIALFEIRLANRSAST